MNSGILWVFPVPLKCFIVFACCMLVMTGFLNCSKVTNFSMRPSYFVDKINLRGNELQFEICKNHFQNSNFD
jgi:hypothetical protein